jgi:hypothetical protein
MGGCKKIMFVDGLRAVFFVGEMAWGFIYALGDRWVRGPRKTRLRLAPV